MPTQNTTTNRQALADAIATANVQLAEEVRAIDLLRRMGQTEATFDLRFALAEERRLRALLSRLNSRLAAYLAQPAAAD